MLTPATRQLRNCGLFQGTVKAQEAEGMRSLPSSNVLTHSFLFLSHTTQAVLLRQSRGVSQQLSNHLNTAAPAWMRMGAVALSGAD